MRILLFTPGTGHFFCGSCLRDNALAVALRERGHDAVLAPLYLPLYLEDAAPAAQSEPLHMGGINMYLQQVLPLTRHAPGPLAGLLDRPSLLRWASRRGNMTDASGLGPMTLSMLRGEEGRQAHELDKLCEWAVGLERPDVVILANAMLLGIVHRLKERLDVPVICTLQGEQPFLDELQEPFRSQTWEAAAQRAREVEAFVAVSRHYGDLMTQRLDLAPERVHAVHNGIDLADYRAFEPAAPTVPTVGYLARMCADKGLDTLVEAFCRLAADDRLPGLRLRVAGVMLREDRGFVRGLRRRLDQAGLGERAEFLPNVDRADKLAFLRSLSVLSVPALYGESFGLYLLEALASGVPVVQPDHGVFPELLAATGGGDLCAAGDPADLARCLGELLADEPRRAELGRRGREAVFAGFGSEHMAAGVEEVCRMIAPA